MKPKHDITKLPKWAQSEIRRLKMKIEEQRREIIELRGTDEPAPVRAVSWNPEDKVPINIPDDFKVIFETPYVRAYIDKSHPEWLYITTQDNTLEIRSVASNAILVRDADPQRIIHQRFSHPIMCPLPDYGDHMTIEDFLDYVKTGGGSLTTMAPRNWPQKTRPVRSQYIRLRPTQTNCLNG